MKRLVALLMAFALIGCAPEQGEQYTELGEATDCSPQGQRCTVAEGEHGVTVLLPESVRPLTQFPVQVQLQGTDARSVTVAFTMVGMDMGINRFALKAQGGAWRGQVILPVCTAGRADWVATVEVQTDGSTLRAAFPFETLQ